MISFHTIEKNMASGLIQESSIIDAYNKKPLKEIV